MTKHDLDVLARAATYGTIDLEDLAPRAKRTARLSPSQMKRERAAFKRLSSLETRGYLRRCSPLNSRFVIEGQGYAVLTSEGFRMNKVGYWLREDAERPGWAL